MIYTNTVQTNKPMRVHSDIQRDFEFFKDCKFQRFNYPKNEEEEAKIKRHQMLIVIAGEMTGDLMRNNQNVFSRSLLFIDFDDVQDSNEVFLKKVTEKMKGANYCLYPTLKFKPEAIRYRLVLELDRPVNADEYVTLLFGLSEDLGVKFKLDNSNKTWSQGQGLPIKTEFSKDIDRIYHDGFNAVPVDKFLIRIRDSDKWKSFKQSSGKKSNFKIQKGGERKFTGQFLEELFEGETKGNRNTWWYHKVQSMLKVTTPVETIFMIMETVNATFDSPLPAKELENIYLSAINKHVKEGGFLY